MPRIPASLRRQALAIDPLLPALLPECRHLEDARSELRWLKEHAAARHAAGAAVSHVELLHQLVNRRARGVPLQYLLGSEHFGSVELRCRPGVFIPRTDTAKTISYLVRRLRMGAARPPATLRILDLCTGSGSIPLLFWHAFYFDAFRGADGGETTRLEMMGVDMSPEGLQLARENQAMLLKDQFSTRNGAPSISQTALHNMLFYAADVLSSSEETPPTSPPSIPALLRRIDMPHWDILISNPPYISPRHFLNTTSRSVRMYEPKAALVPPAFRSAPDSSGSVLSDSERADLFYPRLLGIARRVDAKLALFEVADMAQALRVANVARRSGYWEGIEVWRDDDVESLEDQSLEEGLTVRGQGNGRAVMCWREDAEQWLGRSP